MANEYDVIVVGAGPAGLSAARVVAQAGLSCGVIDKMGPGGQLMNMGRVHEVPGLDDDATGPDLLATLVDAAMGAAAEIVVDEVTGLEGGGSWTVNTLDGTYRAKAVVVATGLDKGTTGLADEARFDGLGLSHCAACDGPLYAGKSVVVTGHGDWAVQEAIDLAAICTDVTLISETARLDATRQRYAEFTALANARHLAGRIERINGEAGLAGIEVVTPERRLTVPARAIFPMAGRKAATGFLAGRGRRNADDALQHELGGLVDAAGIFACGDVTADRVERIVAAIADGERAGHDAVRWLRSKVAGGSPA